MRDKWKKKRMRRLKRKRRKMRQRSNSSPSFLYVEVYYQQQLQQATNLIRLSNRREQDWVSAHCVFPHQPRFLLFSRTSLSPTLPSLQHFAPLQHSPPPSLFPFPSLLRISSSFHGLYRQQQ
ncbi:unnamed protein product [Closterium sp. NIES-53]